MLKTSWGAPLSRNDCWSLRSYVLHSLAPPLLPPHLPRETTEGTCINNTPRLLSFRLAPHPPAVLCCRLICSLPRCGRIHHFTFSLSRLCFPCLRGANAPTDQRAIDPTGKGTSKRERRLLLPASLPFRLLHGGKRTTGDGRAGEHVNKPPPIAPHTKERDAMSLQRQ